jgi:hypothetical protein
MPFITVTNTLVNGATADATQVNQNFTDVINGTSDGTKNFNISALTTAGTLTSSGNTVIGASSSNTVTFNASLAATLPIQTNTSFDIGAATLGLRAIYLGGTSTFTTKVQSATLGGSWTMTLPTAAGTAGQILQTDGTGVTSWSNPITASYAQVYVTNAATTWTSTGSGFNDGTIGGGTNAITVRQSSGITVTAGGSSVCGITFTPASTSAVYLVTAVYSAFNTATSASSDFQLTDGTTVISFVGYFEQAPTSAVVVTTQTLTGIYIPGVVTPVTLKIQLGGTATAKILTNGFTPVEWTIIRIF